jgi:hypothetical protein
VNQRKSILVALALTVGPSGPCAAQQAPIPPQTAASEACAEYFGCLHYGTLTEAQARTARGHPEFVEPPSEIVSRAGATADRVTQARRGRVLARH